MNGKAHISIEQPAAARSRVVRIDPMEGDWSLPAAPAGAVLFAHGSGSSRHSPRNQAVARMLQGAGIATLLFDLLTAEEEAGDTNTRGTRFDIPGMADRLIQATKWVARQPEVGGLGIGYFGASTGGAAAL